MGGKLLFPYMGFTRGTWSDPEQGGSCVILAGKKAHMLWYAGSKPQKKPWRMDDIVQNV
ncbi:hypothetical protein [Aquicoccus sp.]|uniref:hypothetical protein n=1 Tax=Aquicoccus sp. TaxID=2055851 RepID=UPI003564B3A2